MLYVVQLLMRFAQCKLYSLGEFDWVASVSEQGVGYLLAQIVIMIDHDLLKFIGRGTVKTVVTTREFRH